LNAKSLQMSGEMMRAWRADLKTQTRRIVRAPETQGRDAKGKACGAMLFDLSRATVDGVGADQYLHVPFAHPSDGWAKNPADDTRMRVGARICSGDTVLLRENFRVPKVFDDMSPLEVFALGPCQVWYEADGVRDDEAGRPRNSMFLPHAWVREQAVCVNVRVQRVQEISETDAMAEGIPRYPVGATPIERFREVWENVNGPGAWARNDLVWVYGLDRVAKAGGVSRG